MSGSIEAKDRLLDLPHDLVPPLDIAFSRLLVDQLVDFVVAIPGVIALRPAQIVLVKHLLGIIEPGLGDGEREGIVLAHDRRIPLGRIDGVERAPRMEELRRERARPRAADDFPKIRARMEELRRERALLPKSGCARPRRA